MIFYFSFYLEYTYIFSNNARIKYELTQKNVIFCLLPYAHIIKEY